MDELTDQQQRTIADLQIQSMMFDMDIDWELATLIPKTQKEQEPFWLKRWKEKTYGGDQSTIDNGF